MWHPCSHMQAILQLSRRHMRRSSPTAPARPCRDSGAMRTTGAGRTSHLRNVPPQQRHNVAVTAVRRGSTASADAPHEVQQGAGKRGRQQKGGGQKGVPPRRGATTGPGPEGLDEAVRVQRQARAAAGVAQARSMAYKRSQVALQTAAGGPADQPEGCYLDAMLSALETLKLVKGEQRGRGRGRKKGTLMDLLALHATYFEAALDLEFQEEWEESEARMLWSKTRLQNEGWALFDLEAALDGALYKHSVVRLSVRAPALPFHNFSQGDIVLVSDGNPRDDAYEGVIVDVAARWLRIALPARVAPEVQGTGWRVDTFANPVAYERQRAALAEFQMLPPQVEPQSSLRRLLYGDALGMESLEAACASTPPHMKPRTKATELKLACSDLRTKLNASQVEAIKAAASGTLTLWQGPPGTGKTRSICQLVTVMHKLVLSGKCNIMVSAASNVATDNLVAGLLRLGMRVVRIGMPAKVAEHLRESTLDALLMKHPLGIQAEAMRQKAAGLTGPAQANAFQQAQEMEKEAADWIIAGADVVACTCVGAGGQQLADHTFAACVIDEATQATEPASLVAILKGAESLVLVGDQMQLPPTVKCREASQLGLDASLFVRLMAMGVTPRLLDTQYRMHPALAEFSSYAFYGDRLRNGVTAADRLPLPSIAWPSAASPVVFIDCDGVEERCGFSADSVDGTTGTSLRNMGEVEVVRAVVERLLRDSTLQGPQDIGVISAYSAQVKELTLALAPTAARASRTSKGGQNALEIKTVDGFQGREKEVIVVSTVRSNSSGSIGFLQDARRLNVAFTRAKRGLIVVGNARTLRSSKLWNAWLGWLCSQPAGDQHIVHGDDF